MSSCAPSIYGREHPVDTAASVPSLTLIGDWNDIEASVDVAARQVELAPLTFVPKQREDGTREEVISLLASDDREFFITATQASPGAGELTPGNIRFVVEGRPNRDAQRETALLHAIAKRMTDLKGVEWAPIRE